MDTIVAEPHSGPVKSSRYVVDIEHLVYRDICLENVINCSVLFLN